MNDQSEEGKSTTPCPVVGIGTSAGGVLALQAFFEALPKQARERMAYVVVVHLDPTHQSELASILATRASMPVIQVDKRTSMEPGHVYVIAPDRRLQITDHEISSVAFTEPRGQRAPIDLFFRSLAEQRGDGFAVILTGAGSDGAIGVRAVKESGGLILVQDPREAEYPSMPRSAIATGVADFVLPVREIAVQLGSLLDAKPHIPEPIDVDVSDDMLTRILNHLRTRTGHDFSKYKRTTVLRRLARRMQVHRKDTVDEYYNFFRDNAEEIQALFADLLISVTAFFRDPRPFEVLAQRVIPTLFEGKTAGDRIRVWVPGCATGEEAYSIAILLAEEAARREIRPHLQIFASDLDGGALAIGPEGRFPAVIEADVSEERLRRFFDREGDSYRIKREVRDSVLFAAHSLLKDPPFSRLDMISCRNLLIYLDRELQNDACDTFAYALQPGGYLFLGTSENAETVAGLFHIVDRDARIYRVTAQKAERLSLPKILLAPHIQEPPGPRAYPRPLGAADAGIHRAALEDVSPPSILVNESYAALHFSETAGRYLIHPGGASTNDITELVRPELQLQLRAALHRAFASSRPSLSPSIPVRFNGAARAVHVQVRPVRRENAPPTALVFFLEGDEVAEIGDQRASAPAPEHDGEAMRQLYDELNTTRGRLKASIEEHESASEELRAANEELQSMNEEYRSTAEELETSKEELQSVNEELQTVNNELKLKLESMSRAHSDLQNLISATDVGTLFLDTALHIKRFTPRMGELFNIAASDEGRAITDFTHRLKYDDLAEDALRVIRELGSIEKEIETDQGRWYLMRVRPYRTLQDRIEGVVVTFVDVTARRKAEIELRESETRLQLAREVSALGVLDYNPRSKTIWLDGQARELWGVAAETIGFDELLSYIHPDDAADLRTKFRDAIEPRNGGTIASEFRIRTDGKRDKWLRMNGKAFFEGDGAARPATRLVSTVLDVSQRKMAELIQQTMVDELGHRIKNTLSVVLAMARHTLRDKADRAALQAFEGRMQSLANAHQLLLNGETRGAELSELVRHELASHLGNGSKRVSIDGPEVHLASGLATSFAMMVHELTTNAIKYGSLSNSHGVVHIEWKLGREDGHGVLKFVWREKDGPAVSRPTTKGFGSQLMERGLPDAKIKRDFGKDGLICTIEMPLHDRKAEK